jgi:hypothetical protein
MSTLNRRYPAIQGELEDEYEFEDEYETGFEGEAGFEGEEEIEGEGAFESESEEEFEFEFETAAEAELEAEGELEDEFEDEDEDEAEGFVNPIRRIYRDAETMAHLARQAAMTESEGEAEAFIGALVPLAAKLIPRPPGLSPGTHRRWSARPGESHVISAVIPQPGGSCRRCRWSFSALRKAWPIKLPQVSRSTPTPSPAL